MNTPVSRVSFNSNGQTSRNEAGDPVEHPLCAKRGAALLRALEGFDAELVAAMEDGTRSPLPPQDRPVV